MPPGGTVLRRAFLSEQGHFPEVIFTLSQSLIDSFILRSPARAFMTASAARPLGGQVSDLEVGLGTTLMYVTCSQPSNSSGTRGESR